MNEPIRLATFPRGDAAFRAFVRSCLAESPANERADPACLQARLRRWHTRAVVRVQSDLARVGPEPTWYVYRDGHTNLGMQEGWWTSPGIASVSFDASGTCIHADAAAHALLGRTPGVLDGLHWRAFLPEEFETVNDDWIWDLITTEGSVNSVFEVPLYDGGRRVVEYHCEWRDDPPRFVGFWRELAMLDREALVALGIG